MQVANVRAFGSLRNEGDVVENESVGVGAAREVDLKRAQREIGVIRVVIGDNRGERQRLGRAVGCALKFQDPFSRPILKSPRYRGSWTESMSR